MSVKVGSCLTSDTGKITCMNCGVRNCSLLNELSYNELEVLNKNRYVVHYKAGETICKTGTKSLGLLCLNKGKVKIVRRGVNGTEQIVALRKAVNFIGLRALMRESAYMASAVALEDVSICVIDEGNFFKVIGDDKGLALKIIRLFAHELDETDNRMVNLTQKHVRARLADALLMINEIYGANADTGILNVSLKRAELAALANMTPSNTIRVLSSFVKENLIEVNQRDIIIKNLKALNDISVFGR